MIYFFETRNTPGEYLTDIVLSSQLKAARRWHVSTTRQFHPWRTPGFEKTYQSVGGEMTPGECEYESSCGGLIAAADSKVEPCIKRANCN